jgi:hypothetical protein
MLLRQFANDEKQHDRDNEHGETRHHDQGSGLLAPIGQRRRDSGGCYDRYWKTGQGANRSQPIQAAQRTAQTHGPVVRPG